MTSIILKVICLMLMAATLLPRGVAQSVSLTTQSTTTTSYKTVTVLSVTSAGAATSNDLSSASTNSLDLVNTRTDPACTLDSIFVDCLPAPPDATSSNVTPSNVVVVDTTSTLTSTTMTPNTVTSTHYVLPDKTTSSALASNTNQFADLLGSGSEKGAVITHLVVAVIFLVLGHALALAFF